MGLGPGLRTIAPGREISAGDLTAGMRGERGGGGCLDAEGGERRERWRAAVRRVPPVLRDRGRRPRVPAGAGGVGRAASAVSHPGRRRLRPRSLRRLRGPDGRGGYASGPVHARRLHAFHGQEPPRGWREATPADIRAAAGGACPDVVFTSSPCKGAEQINVGTPAPPLSPGRRLPSQPKPAFPTSFIMIRYSLLRSMPAAPFRATGRHRSPGPQDQGPHRWRNPGPRPPEPQRPADMGEMHTPVPSAALPAPYAATGRQPARPWPPTLPCHAPLWGPPSRRPLAPAPRPDRPRNPRPMPP